MFLLFLLEDLLRAGGRDVQEPPGCAGVQLLLVPTQRPHVHHSHHLPLDHVEKRCQFPRDRQKYCLDSLYSNLLTSDSVLKHEEHTDDVSYMRTNRGQMTAADRE